MDRSELKKFVRDDGVLDEFVVMICRKKDSPLHCMLFRSHVAYLGHETNTESLIAEFCLFSRAGTHMYMHTVDSREIGTGISKASKRVPIYSPFATQASKQASSYFRQRNWVQAREAQIRFPAG